MIREVVFLAAAQDSLGLRKGNRNTSCPLLQHAKLCYSSMLCEAQSFQSGHSAGLPLSSQAIAWSRTTIPTHTCYASLKPVRCWRVDTLLDRVLQAHSDACMIAFSEWFPDHWENVTDSYAWSESEAPAEQVDQQALDPKPVLSHSVPHSLHWPAVTCSCRV